MPTCVRRSAMTTKTSRMKSSRMLTLETLWSRGPLGVRTPPVEVNPRRIYLHRGRGPAQGPHRRFIRARACMMSLTSTRRRPLTALSPHPLRNHHRLLRFTNGFAEIRPRLREQRRCARDSPRSRPLARLPHATFIASPTCFARDRLPRRSPTDLTECWRCTRSRWRVRLCRAAARRRCWSGLRGATSWFGINWMMMPRRLSWLRWPRSGLAGSSSTVRSSSVRRSSRNCDSGALSPSGPAGS